MPSCPHCREIYFGNPDQCPKCYYEFKTGIIRTPSEISQQNKYERELKAKREAEERERAQKEHDTRTLALLNSAHYEYKTEYLYDSNGGMLDKRTLDNTLGQYASAGWKLHSVITNEAGKNMHSVGIGGTSFGTNATMDVTILIFERCVKQAVDPNWATLISSLSSALQSDEKKESEHSSDSPRRRRIASP